MNANPNPAELVLTAEMRTLIVRAEAGDRTVLPDLKKMLDENPALWAAYGDLAAVAERNWLDLITGKSLTMRESIERKLAELRNELGQAEASPLEGLLIQRVTSSWLMANYADGHLAQLRAGNANPTLIRVVEGFGQKAHHRYLAAIRQLASVRKLLTPARSPIEIATRLGQRRESAGPRCDLPFGVGVEN